MDDDLLQEFLNESWEMISQLDQDIKMLEEEPCSDQLTSEKLIESIFQSIHTVKGSCRFVGLEQIGAVALSTENLLDKMRQKRVEITSNSISQVIEGIDCIKDLMAGLDATGVEPQMDLSGVIERLDALSESAPSGENVVSSSQNDEQTELSGQENQGMIIELSKQVVIEETVSDESEEVSTSGQGGIENLVVELVLTRDQLVEISQTEEESPYKEPVSQLDRITSDLHLKVMETGTQSEKGYESGMPHSVRTCQEELIPFKGEEESKSMIDIADDKTDEIISVTEERRPKIDLTGARVLVIDESLFFRNLVATAVESVGGLAETVATIEDFLMAIDRGDPFQTIIAGVDTLGDQKSQLIEIIRGLEDYESISLIGYSDQSGSYNKGVSLDAGFDRHLVKFNARELNETIRDLTVGKQAESSIAQ